MYREFKISAGRPRRGERYPLSLQMLLATSSIRQHEQSRRIFERFHKRGILSISCLYWACAMYSFRCCVALPRKRGETEKVYPRNTSAERFTPFWARQQKNYRMVSQPLRCPSTITLPPRVLVESRPILYYMSSIPKENKC